MLTSVISKRWSCNLWQTDQIVGTRRSTTVNLRQRLRLLFLWQQFSSRIGKASILIIGICALSNEICKNLALAGVASITLLDHEEVKEEDLGAQFFLSEDDIGKNVSIYFSILSKIAYDWLVTPRELKHQSLLFKRLILECALLLTSKMSRKSLMISLNHLISFAYSVQTIRQW